jgi:hypothetical protein
VAFSVFDAYPSMLQHEPVLHSALWLSNISFMDISYFVYLPVGEHLGCFHFGALGNNAAINIPVQVFVKTLFFSSVRVKKKSGISRSYGNYI